MTIKIQIIWLTFYMIEKIYMVDLEHPHGVPIGFSIVISTMKFSNKVLIFVFELRFFFIL